MTAITLEKIKDNFSNIIENISFTHEPLMVMGKKNNVVILDETDWHAIEETAYLNSIPGMAESITKEMKSDKSEYIDENELDW